MLNSRHITQVVFDRGGLKRRPMHATNQATLGAINRTVDVRRGYAHVVRATLQVDIAAVSTGVQVAHDDLVGRRNGTDECITTDFAAKDQIARPKIKYVVKSVSVVCKQRCAM